MASVCWGFRMEKRGVPGWLWHYLFQMAAGTCFVRASEVVFLG